MQITNTLTGAVQSKTIWISALLAGLGVIVASTDVLQTVLTPKVYGITMIVIAAIMAALRMVTTDSLTSKGTPDTPPTTGNPQP